MLRTQPGEKRGSGGGKPLGAPPPWVQPKFGNYTDPKSFQHRWSCRNAPGEVNHPGTAPRRAPLHPQPTSMGSLSHRPPRGFSFPLQSLSSPWQPRFASLPQLLLRSQPQLLLFDTSLLMTCTGSGGGREPAAASPVGWEPPSSRSLLLAGTHGANVASRDSHHREEAKLPGLVLAGPLEKRAGGCGTRLPSCPRPRGDPSCAHRDPDGTGLRAPRAHPTGGTSTPVPPPSSSPRAPPPFPFYFRGFVVLRRGGCSLLFRMGVKGGFIVLRDGRGLIVLHRGGKRGPYCSPREALGGFFWGGGRSSLRGWGGSLLAV